MEDEATLLEPFPLVRLLPCQAVSIISLLATNPSLLLKFQSSRKDPALVMRTPTKCPTRTPIRRARTSWPRTRLITTRRPRTRWTLTRLNLRSAVVTLATAAFTSITSLEARSLRANEQGKPLTDGAHVALQ